MNKQRRQQLYDATSSLDDAIGVIQDVQSEEEESFYNLPDGLQVSDTGDAMQEAIAALDVFVEKIDQIKMDIEDFIENKK